MEKAVFEAEEGSRPDDCGFGENIADNFFASGLRMVESVAQDVNSGIILLCGRTPKASLYLHLKQTHG